MVAYSEKELAEATSIDKACLVLKKRCLNLTNEQMHQMLKKSFNLNLKALVSSKLAEERLKQSRSMAKFHYLPFVDGASSILSFEDVPSANLARTPLGFPPLLTQILRPASSLPSGLIQGRKQTVRPSAFVVDI
jgi:hypothetical protein